MTEPRILVAYHSAEGQSALIAERIAERLREGGAAVDLLEVADAPAPGAYDGVVLGDSVHAGRHSRALTRYIGKHAEELDTLPVALFQTSLTSSQADAEHTAEAHQLLHRLLDGTGLEPDIVGLFAGALAYTRYGWLKRRMMRHIAESEGGDVDVSTDHEYTDWEAVDAFAHDMSALVRSRTTSAS